MARLKFLYCIGYCIIKSMHLGYTFHNNFGASPRFKQTRLLGAIRRVRLTPMERQAGQNPYLPTRQTNLILRRVLDNRQWIRTFYGTSHFGPIASFLQQYQVTTGRRKHKRSGSCTTRRRRNDVIGPEGVGKAIQYEISNAPYVT